MQQLCELSHHQHQIEVIDVINLFGTFELANHDGDRLTHLL